MGVVLTDTHCHIHEASRPLTGDDPTRTLWAKAKDADPDHIIYRAKEAGVTQLICVGTTVEDSAVAVSFVRERPGVYASIGIHPHEAKRYASDTKSLGAFSSLLTTSDEGWRPAGQHPPAHSEAGTGRGEQADRTPTPKVVAIGECGLDYYYNHSPKKDQEHILRFQIELALKHNLPLIFHIRDAFKDFWPIFDSYPDVHGVIHSFSATQKELEQILARGLYVGLNGIMTFTKNEAQLAAAKAVPLDHLLLETDAPFLTPTPYRGTICEPKHVRVTAEFLASLRGEPLVTLAKATTKNAQALFRL